MNQYGITFLWKKKTLSDQKCRKRQQEQDEGKAYKLINAKQYMIVIWKYVAFFLLLKAHNSHYMACPSQSFSIQNKKNYCMYAHEKKRFKRQAINVTHEHVYRFFLS